MHLIFYCINIVSMIAMLYILMHFRNSDKEKAYKLIGKIFIFLQALYLVILTVDLLV